MKNGHFWNFKCCDFDTEGLPVFSNHLRPLFTRQRLKIGFPSRAPSDMPLPYSAQQRAGVFVIPGSHFTFFAALHNLISNCLFLFFSKYIGISFKLLVSGQRDIRQSRYRNCGPCETESNALFSIGRNNRHPKFRPAAFRVSSDYRSGLRPGRPRRTGCIYHSDFSSWALRILTVDG